MVLWIPDRDLENLIRGEVAGVGCHLPPLAAARGERRHLRAALVDHCR